MEGRFNRAPAKPSSGCDDDDDCPVAGVLTVVIKIQIPHSTV